MEQAAKDGVSKQREAERALEAAGRKDAVTPLLRRRLRLQLIDRLLCSAARLRRLRTRETSFVLCRPRQGEPQEETWSCSSSSPCGRSGGCCAGGFSCRACSWGCPHPRTRKRWSSTGLGLNARKAWLESEISAAIEQAELRHALEESLARRAALGRRFPHLASPGKSAFERTPVMRSPLVDRWTKPSRRKCALL